MRLIDADALKDLILQRFDMPDLYLLAHIIHLIDETQTADAVPVVRCKDCKNFVESDPSHPDCDYCKRMCWFGIIGKNDYCSKGERKENDNG